VESKQEERIDLRQDDLATLRRTLDSGSLVRELGRSPDLECEAHSEAFVPEQSTSIV
jgi:hypothetical protein